MDVAAKYDVKAGLAAYSKITSRLSAGWGYGRKARNGLGKLRVLSESPAIKVRVYD